MEKFKRYLSLIMAFFILLTSIPVFATGQDEKPNDIKNHWAEKQIKWSYDKGYLSGYPDGSFKPQDNMTNVEYISLIIRILNGNKEIKIDDSNKQMWYSKFIAKAIEIGAINKVENFEPGNNVTRDEAFRLLAFAYSVKGDVNLLDKFTDKDQVINKEAIAGLLERSVVSGYPDDTLRPNNPITRAEIASIVYRGEEVAKLTKIDIDKKDDSNIKAIPVKESDRTNKSYSWNYFYNEDNRNDYKQPEENLTPDNKDDHKKPEENITPDNKTDEKDSLLQKLSALLKKEPEVKDSSNYKNADQDKKTAYDNAIDEGKKITKDNTLEEIKEAIKNIEDSQKALRPKSANIKEEATSVINEAKKDDKEVDTEEDLDRKLKESRIQVDNLDGDYSIIALEKNLTVKGRVIGNEDVVEVGATIVTVDKETQLDGENIKLNSKEFTIDFSNLKPGSNKVNIYAYLADGTLVEKVIFIETITKELTSNKEAIFIEDSDDANEETLNDITVFNSKSDSDVKYIGVLNGSKTSESINKTNIDDKPVLFIRVGTYVARQLDSVVTEDDVRSDIDESRSDEFLPNTTYYKTSSVEFEDLIAEDEINLFFSGFDNSYEPEMIFNENLAEELEKFVKDNNLDILKDIDEENNEEANNSPTPLIYDELNAENNTVLLNDSMEDSSFADGFSMSDEIIPTALTASEKSTKYRNKIKVLGKPTGAYITLPAMSDLEGINARGEIRDINKYTWMSLHGGISMGTNISNLNSDEADKFTKSMIDDLWDMYFNDAKIKKTAACEGAVRGSVGVNADIPLIDKNNKNANANLACEAIYNAIIQSSMQMNLQYSKNGLEIFDLVPAFRTTSESDINVKLNAEANLSAILNEFINSKDKSKKAVNASQKSKLLSSKNNDNKKFTFASVVISPMTANNPRVVFPHGEKVKVSDLIAMTFDLYIASDGTLKIEFNDKRKAVNSINGRIALYNGALENETIAKLRSTKDYSRTINSGIGNYKLYYGINYTSNYNSYTSVEGTLNLNNKLAVEVSPRIIGKRFLYLDTGLKDEFFAEGEAFYYKESKNKNKVFEDSEVTGEITNTIKYFLDLNLENFKIKGQNNFKLINPITIHEFKKDNQFFEFDKKTQTITKLKRKINKPIPYLVIPEEIGGVKVKNIGDKVFQEININKIKVGKPIGKQSTKVDKHYHIQTLYIPNTIEKIGKLAFYECFITEAQLPSSLKVIDQEAFLDNVLKNINLPVGLEKLERAAFAFNKIENVTIPSKIKTIEPDIFYDNQLKFIKIPDHITSIGSSAFQKNNIEKVILPKKLVNIGANAFSSNKLKNIDFPSSVKTIEFGAFAYNLLENVVIPKKLTEIEEAVFAENKLKSLDIPKNIKSIGNGAFSENKYLSEVILPNSITSIGQYCFENDKSLKSVVIPNSVKTIGLSAFRNCSLENVVLSNSLKEISFECFANNKLQKVIIPNSVTKINTIAFKDNVLREVVLPNSLKEISVEAFKNNKIKKLIIPNSVEQIYHQSFYNNELEYVKFPNKKTTIHGRAFQKNNLKKVELSKGTILDSGLGKIFDSGVTITYK